MIKFLLAASLSFSFASLASLSSAVAAESAQTYVTGVIEHVEAMENEAMVKVSGISQLFIIKNLMSFPEAKLQALMSSQETKATVKLVVKQNQIIDVIL
ncbi:hypothetical protein [Bdellovibrio svalbardensis]|uniref:Uncharacterized protein n=1 Tax=Bdellovibrio svalbardensis TaxID=2972972 RepID=A0ABT6DI94_9BACT|nr:hypothetical protein [Bdellovibrio svalbardensis]MDG0815960.1 hypothetical protein [Bdellovibrio svalbardensis]